MRSLVNCTNFAKLETFLDGLYYKPDLLCISETWVLPLISGAFNNLTAIILYPSADSVVEVVV